MGASDNSQTGFTLIEIAIVLLIATILLGYTVALFPKQQELKRYRDVEKKMDEVIAAIIGFAQVNGRLPCPAIPNSGGAESGGGGTECTIFGGFVPATTIGVQGGLNGDTLLLDPWGNPFRYYVSDSDTDADTITDFVRANEMQDIGLVDQNPADTFIDLDGRFHICDVPDAVVNDLCEVDVGPPIIYQAVFGRSDATTAVGPFGGAPFVLLSHGKDRKEAAATGDQLVNLGNSLSLFDLGLANGPLGIEYMLKDMTNNETVFVKRTTGFADDFDDVVKWVSPNILYSKMIEAGQLP